MNQIEFEKMKLASWQRRLTEQENSAIEAHFAAHPETRTDWDEEFALAQTLRNVPEVPVSSNFTALVLRVVERESAQPLHDSLTLYDWLKRHWLRSTALASLLVCGGFISAQQYRSVQRMNMAQGVSAVSQAAAFPHQWLEDFDAINRFEQPPVDNELLAALR